MNVEPSEQPKSPSIADSEALAVTPAREAPYIKPSKAPLSVKRRLLSNKRIRKATDESVGGIDKKTEQDKYRITHEAAFDAAVLVEEGAQAELAKTTKERDEALENAGIDPLTKLPNRKRLGEDLAKRIAEAQRTKAEAQKTKNAFYVLFFDIDHFKDVNDAYGHAMGDSFLRKIKELRGVSRLEEDIYRYGGDEFVQIVENIEEEELIHIIERYQSTAREISSGLLGNAPLVENMKPETTVRRETDFSIGIAKFLPNDTADTLMARADVAMQHAKLHEGTASIAYGGSEAEMNYRQIN